MLMPTTDYQCALVDEAKGALPEYRGNKGVETCFKGDES